MGRKVFGAFLVAGMLLAELPANAHHAIQAQYDFKKPVEVQGVISKVLWTNPHGYVYLDVTDRQGAVTTWELQMGGPSQLQKAGLGRRSRGGMDVGARVTAVGFQGLDGSATAWLTKLVMEDGRTVTIWFGDPR